MLGSRISSIAIGGVAGMGRNLPPYLIKKESVVEISRTLKINTI
jgi:hypothetical protein